MRPEPLIFTTSTMPCCDSLARRSQRYAESSEKAVSLQNSVMGLSDLCLLNFGLS